MYMYLCESLLINFFFRLDIGRPKRTMPVNMEQFILIP